MSGKRGAQASASKEDQPSTKKAFVAIPPVNLGPISTEEELDKKVLQFQNKKLYARLEEKNAQEEEFKTKISELERIRANDQAIISLLNRAWNQLDEDVMILLQRYDDSQGEDENTTVMSDTTVAFLEKLSDRTTKGMEEEISKRVCKSKELICKLVSLIDKTLTRSHDIAKLIQDSQSADKEKAKSDVKQEAEGRETSIKEEESIDVKMEDKEDETKKSEEEKEEAGFTIAAIELAIKQENAELKQENRRLHDLVTSLHEKHHSMSSEFTELHDKHATAQKEISELNSKTVEMEYDLQKTQHQIEKLIKRINEMQEQGKGGSGGGFPKGFFGPGANQQVDELRFQLEEQRELAENRLKELEAMQESNSNLVKDHEKLKLEAQSFPEDIVMKTATYKTLQTQFTLLFAEAQTLKTQAEEARRIILSSRSQHAIQMEVIETEAALTKKKLRTEVSHLEKALVESRRELELLRVEYEHNMKAHEQIGPMAKEMRHLINSLQNHNQQLKGEVMRYKRKLSEASNRIVGLETQKKEEEEEDKSVAEQREKSPEEMREDEMKKKAESELSPKEKEKEREPSPPTSKANESDIVKELKAKLKQAKESQKELKLLLDMYKGASKETREKIELLRDEEKLKGEINDLKEEISRLHGELKKKSQKADEDLQRKLKHAEDKILQLQKCLANTKQEEDALLAEMEFTGQAFEEMQEQNIRLMQQLREKDDSNLKLMSERIKANQVQKLLREEKEALTEQLQTFTMRHQNVEEVIKRLEDREKVLQTALQTIEKEAQLRQQAGEMHKRKATETIQQAQELTYKCEEIQKQLKEAKEAIIDKSNSLEEESFKCRRMYEENGGLKRKIEKAKKMEYLGASDEILVEEVKMYKAKLTCPCCNTRRKDAILTKCFHVFCFECLKTRYDTRQRKCPKCNSNFGNNDFHKIYM